MGSYRILGRIGSGGMAEVFLGKVVGAAGFEKDVAIKCILPAYTADPRLTALLIEEARIATVLNHSHIVQVMDFGKVQDRYFIVMEYVDGANLETIVHRVRAEQARLPMSLAGFVCRQVLSGLAFVHARTDKNGQSLGLVHRDVSPPNILISRAGEVKLADFGIAKATNRTIVTEAGMIRGKVAYMSPEQAAGKPLDHRSDLFSLGVVLHELLTGRELFTGTSQSEILQMVCKAEIEPPSKQNPMVPEVLDSVVMRALAPSRKNRFEDARAFERALENCLRATDSTASIADLEEWLKPVIPARQVETLAAAGELLCFEPSAATPQGTQPIITGETNDAPMIEPRPGRSRGWTFLALLGLLGGFLAVVAVAFLPWGQQQGSVGEPAAIGPATSPEEPIHERSIDAGAEPRDAATERELDAGVPPADAEPAGSDRIDVPTKVLTKPRGEGTLFLNSDPWAKIILDGKDTGVTTPTVEGIKLKAGRHRVTLINPDMELTKTFQITVKKDVEIKRFIDLKKEGVQH